MGVTDWKGKHTVAVVVYVDRGKANTILHFLNDSMTNEAPISAQNKAVHDFCRDAESYLRQELNKGGR